MSDYGRRRWKTYRYNNVRYKFVLEVGNARTQVQGVVRFDGEPLTHIGWKDVPTEIQNDLQDWAPTDILDVTDVNFSVDAAADAEDTQVIVRG